MKIRKPLPFWACEHTTARQYRVFRRDLALRMFNGFERAGYNVGITEVTDHGTGRPFFWVSVDNWDGD